MQIYKFIDGVEYILRLKLLLSWSDEDVMNLHVRRTLQHILDSPGDVLRLETLHTVVDGSHCVWVVRVHGRLELCLNKS